MRDYYTPRLLPRILAGENLPKLPAIAEIRNRVQPAVAIQRFEPSKTSPSRVDVYVRAASLTEKGVRGGLQDLRLFRQGQLVGYREGALPDNTYVFRDVRLPLSRKQVTFTAYAFNSARIKSATVERNFAYQPGTKATPKAYLLQIGVNHYQASGCELRFAVNDAGKLHDSLESRLKARGLEVHASLLVSTDTERSATRERIRRAFAEVAARATPDDVFLLSFAGHGYTTPEGEFYLLPSDITGSCGDPNAELLKNAISADQLAEWVRPIDAGEIAFVLDSCYSAESVEANGFKPGPMGSRGLGQLAYDKRMRILAASRSAALEDPGLGQGLLSYALTEQGLAEGKADWKPKDSQITLGEWLAYGASAVPALGDAERSRDTGRGIVVREFRGAQVPSVFDFADEDRFVIQKR